MKETYKARFCYTVVGEEKSSVSGDERVQKESEGSGLRGKIQFLDAGIRDKDHPIEKHTIYLTELRQALYAEGYPHPISGELVKTVSSIDIKDIAESIRPKPADRMYMYWDRYDEGLFIGGRNSGKCMHVDQCLWSNIGKNYTGWKLLALWSVADSNDILNELSRETFEPPLSTHQIAALRRACRIVLVRPGDVCLFSGGIAHTVISISEELSMTVYESFVSMNPRNIEHWLDSANPAVQHPSFTMPDSDLDSIEDDVLDHLDRVDFVLDREEREAEEAIASASSSDTPHVSTLTPDVEDAVRHIDAYDDFEGHHYRHYGSAIDTAHKHIAAAVECVTRKRKSIDMNHITHSGYLYKQSKHLKRFRRRYCVLIIDKLYTFKQPEDVARGLVTEVLDLGLADYLVEWEITPRVPNYNMISGKFSFEIGTEAETPSRREWMFAAETEDDRRQWIHKLGSYCRHVWRPPRSGLEGQLRLFSAKRKKVTMSVPSGRPVDMPSKPTAAVVQRQGTEERAERVQVLHPQSEVTEPEEYEVGVDNHEGGDHDDGALECVYSDCCCICLKQFASDESVWQLCCGHYFCVRCIQNWSKYKRTCPVCRDVF
ncbi:hypothetical protein FOZ62_009773 [Perkinsus olseni]|uniref:RING-type E3 ubiquitin transferase n=1 Tax=Perkinsus olseni TaxID=32597 RepID=A0A7J6R4J9_PEROL|nr:hypothetical protein FOZ62_009773 [Perkinsus olseni]